MRLRIAGTLGFVVLCACMTGCQTPPGVARACCKEKGTVAAVKDEQPMVLAGRICPCFVGGTCNCNKKKGDTCGCWVCKCPGNCPGK
jgi:hypothetical protein